MERIMRLKYKAFSFISDTSRDFLSLWNLVIILNLTYYYYFMWLLFQNITITLHSRTLQLWLCNVPKLCTWIWSVPSMNMGMVENGLRVALGWILGGAGWWEAQLGPSVCACSTENQPHPGLHQEQCDEQARAGDLFCPSTLPLWDPM